MDPNQIIKDLIDFAAGSTWSVTDEDFIDMIRQKTLMPKAQYFGIMDIEANAACIFNANKELTRVIDIFVGEQYAKKCIEDFYDDLEPGEYMDVATITYNTDGSIRKIDT